MDYLAKLKPQVEQVEVVNIQSESITVGYENNRLKSSQTEETRGTAVRVIKEGRLGFSASSDDRAQEKLIQNVLESASFGDKVPLSFPEKQPFQQVQNFDKRIIDLSIPKMVEMGKEVMDTLLDSEPDLKVNVRISRKDHQFTLRNQTGFDETYQQTPLAIECEIVRVQEEVIVEEEPEEGVGAPEEEEAAPTAQEQRRQQDMGKQKEVRGPSASERAAARQAASARRAAAQRAAEQQVASQGVLGLLTAGGGGGEGDAVVDILGGEGGGGTANLSDVMTGVGGLAVAESQGQRTRVAKGGGRVSSGAGIDELVEGIGTAQSAQLSRKGKITIAGPASVSGRGSKAANRKADVITRVIASHQAAIDFCYQKVAKLNPNLKGEVTVRFAITPDGRTKDIKITRNTLKSRDVERCIIQKVRGWRDFPKIDRKEGDVTVQQKYVF